MNDRKQYGKGLAGFFVGLLLATAVIAGVLFFLNKGGKSGVKVSEQPEPQKKTEVLLPNAVSSSSHSAASSAAASAGSGNTGTAAEINNTPSVQKASEPATSGTGVETPPAVKPASAVTMPEDNQEQTGSDEPKATPPVPHANQPRTNAQSPSDGKPKATGSSEQAKRERLKKQAAAEQAAKLKKQQAEAARKQTAKATPSKAVKPSPEQILESGNLDKARQKAMKDAAEKEQERKKAEAALNGQAGGAKKAAKSSVTAGTSAKGGKVVLQVGSYANKQAADAQRIKLTMLGVSTSVVQGKVNNKEVYRVQTGVLSADSAADVRKTLQRHGVPSLTKSAQ